MSPFCHNKNNKKPVIRQILDLISRHLLSRSINRYKTDKYYHKYKTYDQLVALLFGQLCKCSTLEDISVGIGVSEIFIPDLGLEQSPAKSTMSDGNKNRNYQVFEDFYNELLMYYRSSLRKYSNQKVVEEVKDFTVLIRDSSTIALCLSMFDWVNSRTAKAVSLLKSFIPNFAVTDVNPAKSIEIIAYKIHFSIVKDSVNVLIYSYITTSIDLETPIATLEVQPQIRQ
ncbi:MAG: DUF4372 domain-containing protein [Bacteroidia bacterium]|nr:DUF4372 domain-containing protein [Bacteroidia bacterium]